MKYNITPYYVNDEGLISFDVNSFLFCNTYTSQDLLIKDIKQYLENDFKNFCSKELVWITETSRGLSWEKNAILSEILFEKVKEFIFCPYKRFIEVSFKFLDENKKIRKGTVGLEINRSLSKEDFVYGGYTDE